MIIVNDDSVINTLTDTEKEIKSENLEKSKKEVTENEKLQSEKTV